MKSLLFRPFSQRNIEKFAFFHDFSDFLSTFCLRESLYLVKKVKCICCEFIKWVKYETASIIKHSGFDSFEAATALFVIS